MDSENKQRSEEDKNLNERVDKEIKDREEALKDLQNRMDSQNDDRNKEMDELRTRMMKENAFLKSLAGKPLSVYFDAYRTKAYDGGGEENLTFNGVSCNVGGGLDPESGVFIAPIGGAYIFIFHVATHDNKKALLSIRHNGEEVASIFDQNHKDNHKNSMAGTTILLSLKKGDEVVVYAYTGTWLADFPMNHYTHWVGLLLKPSEEAIQEFRDSAEEGNFEEVPAN
nr:Cerebellin-3 [Lepeophtheirus salmonis]